ncbi:MAG TPA: tetratricopeptide repeat protein [Pyrinomonadaceae bacterium]|nr:tetratricopeptide repeat protein [Pyrinomonadaceae bacterium]
MFTRLHQSTRLSQSISRGIVCSLLLVLTLSLLAGPVASQNERDMPALELGKPIERELAGGQSHSYRIELAMNQFLHVVVEQKGIDVVVTLFAPDGKKVAEVDSPNGTQGPEPVSFIAESAGSYRLEVRSLEASVNAGRYEVKIAERRVATPRDRRQVGGLRAYAQAEKLNSGETAESRRQAIDKYLEALRFWHADDNRTKEAETLHNIGRAYYSLGERQKALDYFNQALPLARALGDRLGEANNLTMFGLVYFSLGENQKALDSFNSALVLYQATVDRVAEARTLLSIATVYDSLGETRRALGLYNQLLPIFRELGIRAGEARVLNNVAGIYDLLGEKEKALDFYRQALPLYRADDDRRGEGTTLNNIGKVYYSLGEKQKALDFYNQALPLSRSVNDHSLEGVVLVNCGLVYESLGEKQKALQFYNQALSLFRLYDRRYEATTLQSIGAIYDSLGEKQKALDLMGKALLLHRVIGDRAGEARTLYNTGAVYDSLGEKQKAMDFYNQALSLFGAVGDRAGEAAVLNSIGVVNEFLGQNKKALDFFNQALQIRRTIGDRAAEAETLNNIGASYDSSKETQKALDFYGQALSRFRAVGDRRGEATTLNNIGRISDYAGDRIKALALLNQALLLFREIRFRNGEASTLSNIASVERGLGNLAEARKQTEAALDIIESLRTGISDQQLRASYFSTFQDSFEMYIDILMRLHKQEPSAGHDAAALQANERARARSLLELLAEANADIRQGVDPKLVESEHSLQQQLNARAQRQLQLLNSPHSNEQALTIAREIESLTTDLQQVEAQIRQTSPRYAALTQPQPLTLKEIQTQVLDEDTLLLEYSLGKDRSYLWAVTPTSIASFELPKRDEVETVARQVYALLTDTKQWDTRTAAGQRELTREKAQTRGASNAAARLSQMLLGPVAAQLGNKRLLVVADGALPYIPFGALPTPVRNAGGGHGSTGRKGSGKSSTREYQPLVVKHEIVSLPSASTLAVLRKEVKDRKPAEKTLAILADPVFESDDDRVRQAVKRAASAPPNSQSGAKSRELPLGMERAATESGLKGAELKIPRLPATRDEARQILSLVPPEQSKGSFDFDASRQTATSGDLSQYRYVHFATHGFLDSVHPELSGIVLSMVDENGNPQDGFLRAHEVFNLKLPAELVVLSACQTGLGKEVKGEGLVSLTRGFMYAGAPRVVVSLWSVNDEATAELMARFYRGMLRDKLRPAAALRVAQVSLMKERTWKSPFYWAAFTIQGEWR